MPSLVSEFPESVPRMKLHLGRTECDRLRPLTVAKREFGFEFYVDDDCHLVLCTNLIKGTAADEEDPDVKLYKGSKDVDMAIASTPFYKEVFKTRKVCDRNAWFNAFGHTHPLLMFKDGYARLSPPSMGDMIAHTYLGNLRNWRENKHFNTMLVVTYEGIYEYGITIPKFKKLVKLTEQIMAKYPAQVRRQNAEDPMELPEIVVEELKEILFKELNAAAHAMFDALDASCVNPDWDIRGLGEVDMKKWRCSGAECAIGSSSPYTRNYDKLLPFIIRFNKSNPYVKRLREMGYYYLFHPWTDDGVTIDVSIKR
jgi:hypothetical protein